jgi:hypothetical protein
MKINLFSFLFLFCIGLSTQAQSIAPQVVANAGDVFKASGFSIEWTLGEIATETLASGASKITQGFHQGSFIITSVSNPQLEGISVYPNPFADHVVLENTKDRKIQISLVDLNGAEILRQTAGQGNTKLDLSSCPSGVLLLQIQSGAERSVYKLEKFQ